jgi:hypothetical protein
MSSSPLSSAPPSLPAFESRYPVPEDTIIVEDHLPVIRLGDDPCGIDPGSILDRYWIVLIRIDPKRNCPLGLKCPIIIGTREELIAY